MQNEVKIVILAAGKGKRMESDEPKALVLYNKKPFIKHILDTISELKLKTKPIIVVGHKKERVKEVLGNTYEYAEQKEQLGTGDAVRAARGHVSKEDKTILVVSADQPTISKETLKNIINTHAKKKPSITLGTAIVPDFDEWRGGMNGFGRIIRGTDKSVKKIVEYKDANEKEKKIKEINLGFYAFDSKWLWANIDKLKNENAQGEYYLTDLVKIAFRQGKRIEAVPVKNIIEGIHPNSKQELEMLHRLAV